MKTEADVLVVGGGIVGLATARALQLRKPGAHVVVIDKEVDIEVDVCADINIDGNFASLVADVEALGVTPRRMAEVLGRG